MEEPELTWGGPDWVDATEDTSVVLRAFVVEAKLEDTKADEVSVVDEERDASVAKEAIEEEI